MESSIGRRFKGWEEVLAAKKKIQVGESRAEKYLRWKRFQRKN